MKLGMKHSGRAGIGRALGSPVDVTPPGYSNPLFYYTGGYYLSRTTGGYMAGGDWIIYTLNDVDRPNTYDACVEP